MQKIKPNTIKNIALFPLQKSKKRKEVFGLNTPCQKCHDPFNCKNCDWHNHNKKIITELDLL